MNGLQTKNLTLQYGDEPIIENLDFDIPIEKITVLVGANGSGKSTLLRSLARLLNPTSGEILLDTNKLQEISTKQPPRTRSSRPVVKARCP